MLGFAAAAYSSWHGRVKSINVNKAIRAKGI
jgi:hypothetical protein